MVDWVPIIETFTFHTAEAADDFCHALQNRVEKRQGMRAWENPEIKLLNAGAMLASVPVVEVSWGFWGMAGARNAEAELAVARALYAAADDAISRSPPDAVADAQSAECASAPSPRKCGRLIYAARFLIPRRQREDVLGDLFEDIAELENAGAGRWKIRLLVGWELKDLIWQRLSGLFKWLARITVALLFS